MHTHLGTSAREDGGHLPVELLRGPKAAGLVEKRVDLRDRAAVARRDWPGQRVSQFAAVTVTVELRLWPANANTQ